MLHTIYRCIRFMKYYIINIYSNKILLNGQQLTIPVECEAILSLLHYPSPLVSPVYLSLIFFFIFIYILIVSSKSVKKVVLFNENCLSSS